MSIGLATYLRAERDIEKARADAAEAIVKGVIEHLQLFCGPDYASYPPGGKEASWLAFAVNHLGGMKQDYLLFAERTRKAEDKLAETQAVVRRLTAVITDVAERIEAQPTKADHDIIFGLWSDSLRRALLPEVTP